MSHEHYFRDVSGLEQIDVYRLLELFGVTCPVAQHVVKKAIAAGQRGHKSTRRDWQDIADSAARKLQMIDEDLRKIERACGVEGGARGLQDHPIGVRTLVVAGHGISPEPATGVASTLVADWPDESRRQDDAAEEVPARNGAVGGDWMFWHGEARRPVGEDVLVDVALRDGRLASGKAGDFLWRSENHLLDIVAWRRSAVEIYAGPGGVMIHCPGCDPKTCGCRP